MSGNGTVVVIGGTGGLGREIGRYFVERGRPVVVTSREDERAQACASDIGGDCRAIAVDLSRPETIAASLASVDSLDDLVITSIERDDNTVRDFDMRRALNLVTLKLVGYVEVVHALLPKFGPTGAIVMFGGLAKDRPYPGSTTISTVNGGISTMVHSMAVELAPIRVNAIHPGIVGDSPYWANRPEAVERTLARTPGRRAVRTRDIIHAVAFLLENESVNGENLNVDSGWMVG